MWASRLNHQHECLKLRIPAPSFSLLMPIKGASRLSDRPIALYSHHGTRSLGHQQTLTANAYQGGIEAQ